MKKHGFTLIEMLVVVGILAVLVALLFPVFASVRENGRRASCQSNLHQIGSDWRCSSIFRTMTTGICRPVTPNLARSAPTAPWNGVSDAAITHSAALWLYKDSTQTLWRKLPAPCGHPVIGSTLHSSGGNYLFADGHVRWLTPESFATVTCANGPLPPPFTDRNGE